MPSTAPAAEGLPAKVVTLYATGAAVLGHTMQVPAAGLLPKPGAQGVHATAPPLGGEKVPMGHAYGAPRPGAGEKKPPGAGVQAAAPAGEKAPSGHAPHAAGVLAPAPALAVPAGHGTQLSSPAEGP
jgi:hypothetical protein